MTVLRKGEAEGGFVAAFSPCKSPQRPKETEMSLHAWHICALTGSVLNATIS